MSVLRAVSHFFSPPAYQNEAHALYVALVAQARQPELYTEYGIADTVDGRFDAIALHLFLLSDRLKKEGSPEALALLRATTEVFFADMDRSLREMGSTDTGVGKRIKKMSQAYYGRVMAYQTAGDDEAKLTEALLRNLYRGDLEKLSEARKMAGYVKRQIAILAGQRLEDIISAC
ncbi:MAG: ubiquinol-cytochrome C chaperone family protein [Alphaproteobacteria bacterium]|nr:ubiquinol-cytochrome C chaperone family protein [Alphaproteobacteria bacterium]